METLVIVAQFNVGSDIRYCSFSGGIDDSVNSFVFQCGKERFRHGIIEAYSGASNRLSDSERAKRAAERGGHVIAATVRVEYRPALDWIVSGGHPDRVLDKRSFVVVVHGPADHGFGVAIDDGGKINPAFPCRNVGDIANHLLARRGRGEVPAE